MSNDYFQQNEIRLDALESKVKAMEFALTQIPQIDFERDVTRPEVVKVMPDALKGA